MRKYLAVLAVLLLVLAFSNSAPGTSEVEGAGGHLGGGGHDFGPFDSRMIPVESQAWWAPNFGHVHGLFRMPLGQTVSGDLNFDWRVVMHNNPSTITFVRVNDDSGVIWRQNVNWTCPYTGTTSNTCAWNVPVTLDTTQLKDGWREFRVIVNVVTPDGQRFFSTTGIPINVQNGGADKDYNRGTNQGFIGRGWYENVGKNADASYTNAWIQDVPLTPVSGTHTFNVRAQKDSEHLTVALDKTHAIQAVGPWPEVQMDMGQILFDQDGNFQDFFPIVIDTNALANGWHSLAVNSRNPNGSTSQCSYCNGEVNRLHGIAKIWFYVDNEGGNSSPTVALTNPGDGDTVSGKVSITANASDDVGVDQVEFFIDGASIGIVTSAPYSVDWDTIPDFSDGTYTIQATATDDVGLSSIDSRTVTVDNVDDPPTIVLTNPSEGETVFGTVVVTADASDDKGVNQVAFFVDGNSIGVDTSFPYAASWDTTGEDDGSSQTVSAIATDSANKTSGISSRTVTVENSTPPPPSEIIVITKAVYSSKKVRLKVEATSSLGDDSNTSLEARFLVGSEWSDPKDMSYSAKKDKWSVEFTSDEGLGSTKAESVRVCSKTPATCTDRTSIGGR